MLTKRTVKRIPSPAQAGRGICCTAMTELVLQALWSGVLTGSSYALIALGLALIFGTMNVINLAHGELVLLAAYVAYTCESAFGASPFLAIPTMTMATGIARRGLAPNADSQV